MDPDHPVFLLNRSKHDIVLWPLPTFPPPHDAIPAQLIREILRIQLLENRPQIEKLALLSERKLPLHRQ